MERLQRSLRKVRRRARRCAAGVAIFLLFPILLLLLPVILPYVAWSCARDDRRLAETECPRCGEPLGRDAVREARDAAGTSSCRPSDEEHTVKHRVVATWRLRCRTCGAEYLYHPGAPAAGLTPADPEPDGERRNASGVA